MAVTITATVDSVTATQAADGIISISADVSFTHGTTELRTRTFCTTISRTTVPARTEAENTLIAQINAMKQVFAGQQQFAAQCVTAKTNIQAGVN